MVRKIFKLRRPRIERLVTEEEIDIGGRLFPMAGVSFLMLLIIMVSVRELFSKSKIEVDLPRTTRIETELEEHITVTITKDGNFYVNDLPVNIENMPRLIEELQRKDPDTTFWYTKLVLIRGDKEINWGNVLKALDGAKLAKSKRVALAVIREKHD